MVAANGEQLELCGSGELVLRVGGIVSAYSVLVARNITQECLLGADFLQKHGCIINLQSFSLSAGGKDIPLVQNGCAICHVSCLSTTVIPGRFHQLLPVQLDLPREQSSSTSSCKGLLEPRTQFLERHDGILVAHSLSSVTDGQTVVDVLNLSPIPVTIHRNEKVASFQPMHEVCVATEMDNDFATSSQVDSEQLVSSLLSNVEGLSQSEVRSLSTLIHKYADIFSQGPDDIGRTSIVRHSIDTGPSAPIKQIPRRLPFHLRGEVKAMLDNMEHNGIIEPSSGPWAAPIVMVKKKDGSWRLCVDYRKLNQVTKKDAHPLPRIDDTLDQLSGAHWFSTLDLASGYWQVELDPNDKEKTVFSTPFGLFQFNVMPFGLCNAPSTFQRLMEMVLAGLHWSICLVYIDDIIVYGRTCQEHLERLEEVFKRLKQTGLKMKPSKCYLLQKRVRYLGHILSEDGVETDPEKVSCIKNWPTPSNVEELRQFLGIATYYRRFVHQFAHIAAPLHRLTNKGSNYHWSLECNDAFCILKHKLSSAPILCFPQFEKEFTVDTDASDSGLGAVLSQVIDGEERVVAYASRTLTKSERHYATTRKEMLALVWALKHFRPYLYGKKFTARTDHKALIWLQSFKHPEGQVARWLQTLAEFQFTVEHRQGLLHSNADALSRRSHPEAIVSTISSPDDTSWAPQWSNEELKTAQQEDADFGIVLQWFETKMPSEFPHHAC